MSPAPTAPAPMLTEAIALMQDINRRLMAGRLSALRVAFAGGRGRVACRVLDGEVLAVLTPADPLAAR